MASDKKTVLITGCSEGGIGAALARAFLAHDYHVFATLRNTSKAGSLAITPGIELLELEVTTQESISRCAQLVLERTGGSLDVLVNNAGADFVMPLLDVDVQKARKLYDLNVWSIITMTQAFAPLLIKAKGCVCNISSIGALGPLAYSGIYGSSKAAATFISEVLRLELQPLGVRVVTGMIGSVQTPIHQNSGDLALPDSSYYLAVKTIISDINSGTVKPAPQPVDITARAIANDIAGGKSGKIWRGGLSSVASWVVCLLPYSVLMWIFNNDKKLGRVKESRQSGK